MKTFVKISIILFSIFIISSLSFAQSCDPNTREPAEDEVIFFEHINYQGCWMGAKIGSYYASLVGNSYNPICKKTINWNDTISSIKVGAKAMVIVYEHVNYGGRSQVWKGNCNSPLCLGDLRNSNWNDKISSFRIDRNHDCY